MLFVPHSVSVVGDRCPVYRQQWFTKIASRYRHARTVVVIEDGETVGSLDIAVTRNFLGMKQAYNLPWARVSGLRVAEHLSEAKQLEIKRQLVKRLPPGTSYFLGLDTERDYKLFLSEGFLPDLEDNYVVFPTKLSSLPDTFSTMTRRHIRQAERELLVSTTSADVFMETYAANLLHQRRKPYAPLAVAHDLLEEGLRRGQAQILTATRRDTGEIDAAVACLWDDERYYYWLTTRRVPTPGKAKPHQGAIKLLVWSAIQVAAAKGLTFDFDGVPNSPLKKDRVKRLYEGLGAQRTVRYKVKRETKLERTLKHLRPLVKPLISKAFGTFMTLKMNY